MDQREVDSSARHVTRGHGLLEGFLAEQRRRRADRLIPTNARNGRLLDVGCGSYPVFLLKTRFAERYGVDRVPPQLISVPGLQLIELDVGQAKSLPFPDSFFDVVTMLAVFEHLERPALQRVLKEVHRVLKPLGTYVMTTPAPWTNGLLNLMARVGLVSHEEIEEHKQLYSVNEIEGLIIESGFKAANVRSGRFEAGVNLWATAQREAAG